MGNVIGLNSIQKQLRVLGGGSAPRQTLRVSRVFEKKKYIDLPYQIFFVKSEKITEVHHVMLFQSRLVPNTPKITLSCIIQKIDISHRDSRARFRFNLIDLETRAATRKHRCANIDW